MVHNTIAQQIATIKQQTEPNSITPNMVTAPIESLNAEAILTEDIDTELNLQSEKPLQNKTIAAKFNELNGKIGATLPSEQHTQQVISVPTAEDLDDIEDPQQDAIYITEDTNDLYIYDGTQFVNVTNQEVDGEFQVKDLDALFDIPFDNTGEAGHYPRGKNYLVKHNYTELVYLTRIPLKIAKQDAYTLFVPEKTTQPLVLQNKDGWAEASGNTWQWHHYIYEETLVKKIEIEPDQNNEVYLKPNTVYIVATPITILTINLVQPRQTDNERANEYIIRFTIDPNATQSDINISFNDIGYRWHDQAPTWVAGATYEMSILDKYIICAQFT